MSAKYEPLKTVIAYFCDQYDKSVGDEDKYWILGFRGLTHLHYNVSAEPKTVRLPVESNKTVKMPSDYSSWTKIGLLNNNGELSTLRVNDSLTRFNSTSPNRLASIEPDITDGLVRVNAPYVNYYNNGSYESLYGIGGGIVTYGSCRVDETNNVIILDPDFGYDSLIVEYISSPEKDSDYLVDIRLREALIAWIAWQTKLDSRANFYSFATEARRVLKPLNLQSFNQTIRQNEKMSLTL